MKLRHLEIYLIDSLQHNDCVIVPGFGGFILNEQGARLLEKHHIIRPPAKVIGFNKNLQVNDGLIAHEIISKESLSYPEAVAHINNEAKAWQEKLRELKRLYLPAIGTFTASEENKIAFEPDYQLNFQNSSFGLSPVQLTPVNMSQEVEEEKIKPVSSAKASKWIAAAAAIAVIFFMSIVLAGYFRDRISSEQEATYYENTNPVESLSEIINDTEAAPSTYTGIEYDYYIIGGSFSLLDNAKKFAEQLNDKGYTATILDNEAGFHRVAYQMEQDSISAGKVLQKIKSEENQAAWILKW